MWTSTWFISIKLDEKIVTDSTGPAEEKALLQTIPRYDRPVFYFVKSYELMLSHQQSLMVRIRLKEY